MAESGTPLSVNPAALYGASGTIGGHAAPLATPSTSAPMSMETAGMAGAALDQALDGYCAAFAARLSSVAAALVGKAGAYTAQEVTSSQTVTAISAIEEV
jgi:hypothetical protein